MPQFPRLAASAVAKCPGIAEVEKEANLKQIGAEIANFSAWHYRSQLPVEFDFKAEIEVAKSAFWTEPHEQSAWIHSRWLLNQPSIAGDAEFLRGEIGQMRELAEDEDTKCPLLALIWLYRKLPQQDEEAVAEVKGRLSAIDPIRAPYDAELEKWKALIALKKWR